VHLRAVTSLAALTYVGFPPLLSMAWESVRLKGDVAPLLLPPLPSAPPGLAGLTFEVVAGALSGSVGTGILLSSTCPVKF